MAVVHCGDWWLWFTVVTGGCGSTKVDGGTYDCGLNSVVAVGYLKYVASIHSAAIVLTTQLYDYQGNNRRFHCERISFEPYD